MSPAQRYKGAGLTMRRHFRKSSANAESFSLELCLLSEGAWLDLGPTDS